MPRPAGADDGGERVLRGRARPCAHRPDQLSVVPVHHHPRYSPTSPFSKRILDVAVAVPLAIACCCPSSHCWRTIKLADRGPVFFRQRRVGEQGREFEIVKLRTMRPDAADLDGLIPRDELLTPIGASCARRTSTSYRSSGTYQGRDDASSARGLSSRASSRSSPGGPVLRAPLTREAGRDGLGPGAMRIRGQPVGTAWKICHDLYYVKRRTIVFDMLIILQTITSSAIAPTRARNARRGFHSRRGRGLVTPVEAA